MLFRYASRSFGRKIRKMASRLPFQGYKNLKPFVRRRNPGERGIQSAQPCQGGCERSSRLMEHPRDFHVKIFTPPRLSLGGWNRALYGERRPERN